MVRVDAKERLFKTYAYRIELHAHTSPASGCGRVPGDRLAENYKAAGYDAVVVTNHFSRGTLIDYYQPKNKEESVARYLADYELAKKTGDRIGIKIYLGAEIRFENEGGNDYLLYGMDEELINTAFDYLDSTPRDFYENGKDPRTLLIQAHPFRNDMTQLGPELLDGFEVFNMHPGVRGTLCRRKRLKNQDDRHRLSLRRLRKSLCGALPRPAGGLLCAGGYAPHRRFYRRDRRQSDLILNEISQPVTEVTPWLKHQPKK